MPDSRYESVVDVPEALARPVRRWPPQLIWVIPIVAVLIGGWLAVKAILDRGPTASISFKTAEGLEAGKTKIKYKNVDVGEVTQVTLSKDLRYAIATVQVVKEAAPYLVEDTRFWVVRPRIAGGQVTGLGTLFTGSYIGADIGRSTQAQTDFVGLETPPLVTGDEPGRHFVLRAKELGSLEIGSPVYLRREPVGRVLAHELDRDGTGVIVRIFVDAPSDRYVTTNTRFWNASGIDVVADSTGIKVHTQSVLSLLLGGLAFETPDSPMAQPADEQTVFTLFADRSQAMKLPDLEGFRYTLYFSESLRGLSVGTIVDFSGVAVGEVTSIGAEYDAATRGIRFPVEIAVYPERVWSLSRKHVTIPAPKERLDGLVEDGFRAQLRADSLLTPQLYVALDFFPEAPKAQVDWTKTPPVLPTIAAGGLHEVEQKIVNVAKKIENMPLDQIGADLHQALQSLNGTLHTVNVMVKRFDMEITPVASRALKTTEQTFAADAPLQQDLRDALRGLNRASQSVRVLGDYLERHPESILRGKKRDER